MMIESVSPFLRWAGSKRGVLPSLSRYLPSKFDRYVEPFAGSACLFFHLHPTKALLADLNQDLIETYNAVRNYPADVASILADMPVSKDDYYFVRALNPTELTASERAARFIYLNRFCFNGLYRTNLKGEFNVPFGSPKTLSVPSRDHLERCARRLEEATIRCGDFEEVIISEVTEGDLVYMDPPFYVTSKRVFREYNKTPFAGDDLSRLCNLLRNIDEAGAKFIVSYSYCEEAKEAFQEWHISSLEAQRNISGFAKHRRKAKELVVTNCPHID